MTYGVRLLPRAEEDLAEAVADLGLRAPIGLDLGETKDPAAVALSILAEVVKVLGERRRAAPVDARKTCT